MKELNHALIRERCTYPLPAPLPASKPTARHEWKFTDHYGNKHGRLTYRPADAAPEATWCDVFGHDVHQSDLYTGHDFAVTAMADDDAFTIHLIIPPAGPVEIFRQRDKLTLHGLSADEQFLLVQSAKDGDWFRPQLLVLDLKGRIHARLSEFSGTTGCYADAWSPVPGDQRIVFRHEAEGWFQPAIWTPFENKVAALNTNLPGEVFPMWDRSGKSLILKRGLDGRSDLHRLDLASHQLETIQPLDGSIFSHALDADNRVSGIWAANHRYVERFCEHERFPTSGFKPSVPLSPWRFERIAGLPCFVVGGTDASAPQWTIFEGYGSFGYHHTDSYNACIHCLVDHGFQVVLVNTRGCAGFGRAWRESTLSNLGFTELEDLRQVRAALVAAGRVEADRTLLMGGSWGGYMTLLGLGTQPELWKAGVALVPVGDFPGAHLEATPLIRAVNRTQFGGGMDTHASVYHKASPLTYVDGIKAPILMLAGKYDLLCPPQQNIRFAEAVRARGGECELHLSEGAHGTTNREERIRHWTLILEFLMRHCRASDAQNRA